MNKQTTTKQKDEQTDNYKTERPIKRQPQNRKTNKPSLENQNFKKQSRKNGIRQPLLRE